MDVTTVRTQELLLYLRVLLALQPTPVDRAAQPHSARPSTPPPKTAVRFMHATEEKQKTPCMRPVHTPHTQAPPQGAPPPFVLLLDLSMEAPVITVPRTSDSEDNLEINLGSLQLSNVVRLVQGNGPLDPLAVVQVLQRALHD